MPSHIVPAAPHHVPPTKSQMIVIAIETRSAILNQKRQNQARRRPTTSSSRSCGALDAEEARPRDQPAEEEVGEAAEDDHDRERGEERPPTSSSRSAA